MKAGETNVLRLLDGTDKKFIIPVFQRPYSWSKKNCKQLMKDLIDVYERNLRSHFFGSIVYSVYNKGASYEHIIIDGQQRIITVSLLLLAIRNYICDNDIKINGINPQKIKSAYLTDEFSDDKKKLKLKLIQGDDEAYDNLIANKEYNKDTNITANYNYFYSEISKMNSEEISGIYKSVTKLDIVGISLDKDDDAQLIFESLNSTGLDLKTVDKIRNYVLMGIESSKEQEEFYKEHWEPLENVIGQDKMDDFIRYYLAIKERNLFSKKDLYFEFKIFKENNKYTIEEILENMYKYGIYFRNIISPSKDDIYYENLKRIMSLDVNTSIPFLMDLFEAENNGKINKEETKEILEIIENFVVRREICGLPTNVYNKLFVQIGGEIEKIIKNKNLSYIDSFKQELLKKKGKSRFPENDIFNERFKTYDLYNAKSTIKKYIFERLENYNNKEKIAVHDQLDDKTLTIEHIMPQTITKEWKNELGTNWELVHSKYKDTIGNLTLSAYNSNYSNNTFEKKKNMKEKGFIYSKLSLNDYVKKCNKWTEKEILNRAELLFKKAIKIWWIPKVDKIEENTSEWYDWDEEFEITNMKIINIEILGTRISTKYIVDATRNIHEILFALEPTVYYKNNLSWFDRDGSNFINPFELSKNAYIELNRNGVQQIESIKQIARYLDLAPQDIKFEISEKIKK